MLRSFAGVLALALPLTAFASGAADGIYSCTARVGTQSTTQYVTVNGQPDGRAIWAVAAVSPSQSFYGYGIGVLSGSSFSGNTSHGGTFNLTWTGTTITGTVGVSMSGTFINAPVNCIKVW